ncbi:16S rRNA (guanine(966)-N(2))-methyltransferase RsmD [Protaetiibacter mangrovi]|uniref:16S rRNA (Guanine(966)-N(2))-methyltransferase RsmD n=1 Tax=Protaetiibacter mangrovi TaxID=2970926 RepID=A0ABT1ZI18_9MICO|nr:16S rRNA (guanine(966)-N(2))-methyltransferase RsmD [Protaetiibacter mangrovi]MCS0500364.1 16S rRNA (guanine(966)-N(2))-methyltransferase RsmD [Protaetiibacter mangrovi]TPX02453.1 16S rRNA (guanine(966)-N(2))-methyltransferase RsmD [Schumannella luteola]
MTRIIAGYAGSLALTVPKTGTRPTSDRVREAIFSALEARDLVHRARVLDLYAGSGALGLEAASRGAAEVTLVDSSRDAAVTSRRNAERVSRAAPATAVPVIRSVVQPVRAFLAGAAGGWHLVFLDPPYELTGAELVDDLLLLAPRVAPDAVIVVERSARDTEPAWPAGLDLDRRTAYGDTAVFWLSPA